MVVIDAINIALMTAGVANTFLGVLIFSNAPTKKINYIYSLNIVFIVGWIFSMVMYRSAPAETAFAWCTILYVFPTAIASSFLYFTYIFPSMKDEYISYKAMIIFGINAGIALLVSIPNVIITEVMVPTSGEKVIHFSSLYILYVAYTLAFFLFGFFRLFRKYLRSDGVERTQILYLFLGYSAASNVAFITNLLFPWFNVYVFNWLGQVVTTIMVGFTGYAIVRYRLMDIRIVVRKLFIYGSDAILIYCFYYGTTELADRLIGGATSATGFIIGVFLAPLFTYIFYTFDSSVRIFANRYLFVSLYNSQETLAVLAQRLSEYIEIDTITDLIVETIKKSMQLSEIGVLIDDNTPGEYQTLQLKGFDENKTTNLLKDNFLSKYLLETRRPLLTEEIEMLAAKDSTTDEQRGNLPRLRSLLDSAGISLCIPLINKDLLIGMIILGPKISQDAYTNEDISLLFTISQQASVAIENALQYRQIKEFGTTLQHRVDTQTESLRTTNNELREKDKLNQELLEMKSDFLRVVNHQLNTPISIMRGYFLMMKEGRYPAEKALPIVESGLDRISQTVSDFWDAYELEGERMHMSFAPVDITSIVNSMVTEKQNLTFAKDRNLIISVTEPNFKVPTVWCDLKKTTHVISNLLDNAIYYTPKGSITVSYELQPSFLKVSVEDTGNGVSEQDKHRIFQKFTRGLGAAGMHPDGSGLGLYIAKKIVEGNGGEISFFSKGPRQGTTFSFTVPVYKDQQSETGKTEVVTRKNKIELFI